MTAVCGNLLGHQAGPSRVPRSGAKVTLVTHGCPPNGPAALRVYLFLFSLLYCSTLNPEIGSVRPQARTSSKE